MIEILLHPIVFQVSFAIDLDKRFHRLVLLCKDVVDGREPLVNLSFREVVNRASTSDIAAMGSGIAGSVCESEFL